MKQLFASVLFASFLCAPTLCGAQPSSQSAGAKFKIGVFDDAKLSKIRPDFLALATKVVPLIAKEKGLSLVVRKSGLAWPSSPVAVDITGDILSRMKRMPSSPVKAVGLTASQKQAARLALKDLLKLRLALDAKLPRNVLKTRMVDVESTVQDASLDLPKGVLKDQITEATSLYKQAMTLWDEVEGQWRREETIRETKFQTTLVPMGGQNLDPVLMKMFRDSREEKEAIELGERMAPVDELFSKASDLLSKAEKSFEQQN